MSLALPAFKDDDRVFPALLLCLALAGGIFCFPLSYLSHSNVVIGLLLFPFTLFITGRRENNLLYLICVLLFAALSLTYHLRIAYFFTLAFFILWLVERVVGKCHPLVVLLVAFMSPVFSQVVTILGFPLRLQLSRFSAAILQMTGLDAQAHGNMIVLEGSSFSVDDACMGLNMLAMSMLIGVFFVGYRHRSTRRHTGIIKLLIFFAAVFALNLITNVIRIVLLVLFRIPPENFMHEIVGLLCFFAYIVVPLFFLSAKITGDGQAPTNDHNQGRSLTAFQKMSMLALALIVLLTGINIDAQRTHDSAQHAEVSYTDGPAQMLKGGITKIATNELLIYVKPIPEFFTGEHTPLMCWKGSGYEFSGIKEMTIGGQLIYAGKLVNQSEELFTAWWYSNGKVRTISQLDWRMRMLKREDKFCLVNITAKDEETLLRNVASIFRDNRLSVRYP